MKTRTTHTGIYEATIRTATTAADGAQLFRDLNASTPDTLEAWIDQQKARALAIVAHGNQHARHDAERAVKLLDTISVLLSKGEARQAITLACQVGHLMERASIRPAEPLVVAAVKRRRDLGKARAAYREKQQERYRIIAETVGRILRSNRKNTLTYAREQAAMELGIGISTVIRATKKI